MKDTTVRYAKQQALLKYEDQKDEIKRLLQQIRAGLEEHDRNASLQGGHHWGHVGDLNKIESELRDIRDRLMREGEYAEAAEIGHHHGSLSRRKMIKAVMS